jgi:hypothetical protein
MLHAGTHRQWSDVRSIFEVIPEIYLPLMITTTVITALLVAGVLVSRLLRTMGQRIARLEDALRTYNNANAAVGRHVTLLESEIRGLQNARPDPATEPPVLRHVSQKPAPSAVPSSLGERRLAELLRSRLGGQHLN